PFVLCHLEGRTQAEVARELGCPTGTVATRLARARQHLRTRLTRRGVTLSAGLLAALLAQGIASAAVPTSLIRNTVQAVLTGPLPAGVALLVKGVCRAMLMERMKKWAVAAVVALFAFGVSSLAYQPAPPPATILAEPPPLVRNAEDTKPAQKQTKNFTVSAPNAAVAQLVAEAAERARVEQAKRWLGKELPDWDKPCPVLVKLSTNGGAGATTFSFDKGKVLSREMHVEGVLERILVSNLPHEVTHTVLADALGRPVPRWA